MTERDILLVINGKEGIDINAGITELHPDGDELALHRKAIMRLYELLNLEPDAEFLRYNEEAERIKAEVKHRLHPDEELSEDE